MTEQVSLHEAQALLEDLVHRAAAGARFAIKDDGGPSAVLIDPDELAHLEAVASRDCARSSLPWTG